MIALSVALNIYVVAVISYGIDHQLQNVMLINTLSAQKIYLMFVQLVKLVWIITNGFV